VYLAIFVVFLAKPLSKTLFLFQKFEPLTSLPYAIKTIP